MLPFPVASDNLCSTINEALPGIFLAVGAILDT